MLSVQEQQQYQASLKHPDVEETIDLWFYRPVGFRLALFGKRLHWTPNQITVASIFLGIGCGLLLYPNIWWINLIGLLLLVMADVCDSADGQLARLTQQYSQLGRILDGAAGDFWFISIYVSLCLRLMPEWGLWCWVLAILAGVSHSQQSAMADYYRQFHLLCVSGRSGSELDDAATVSAQYDHLRMADDPVQKIFLWFYRNYTYSQERLTPQLQCLRRLTFDSQSIRPYTRPLMPIANALTFNCRAITLSLSVLLGLPWLYWVIEVTLFNALAFYMVSRHEAICRRFIALAGKSEAIDAAFGQQKKSTP